VDCQRQDAPDLGTTVRQRPLLAVAIVTHLVTRLRAGLGLATWMQTIGAALHAVKRRSVAGVQTTAQDGRSARGLLYLTAVRAMPSSWTS